MKIPPSPDRENLQQTLANTFATQESQIDSQSLSAVMDLHLDGAMRYIVESTQKVANAAGVGIALLKRDRLIYRAGIGCCAPYVGRQVTASLTVSAQAKNNHDILRVENARTDTRIEADICRQFGANALLLLPIYYEGAVAGVLDVRFNHAHTFEDSEVGAYRSLAGQVELALTRAAQLEHQPEQHQAVAAASPAAPDAASVADAVEQPAPVESEQFAPLDLEQVPPPDPDKIAAFELEQDTQLDGEQLAPLEEEFVPGPAFMMLPQNEHSLYARCAAVFADIRQMAIFKQTAWLASRLPQGAKKLASPSARPTSTVVATRKFPTFKRPTLPGALLAQRTKILTWPERGRHNVQAAAAELSSAFKRMAASATILGERAKSVAQRLLNTVQAAARELSTVLAQSASRAVARTRRAKNITLPNRWRNSAQAAATEFSSALKRTASSAATLPQGAQNVTLPNRWGNFAQAMAAAFSSVRKRTASSVALVGRCARNFTLPSGWRNAALTAVAVVLAFVAGIVYKSHSSAKPLESSTLPSAGSTNQPALIPKPAASKAPAAVQPAPPVQAKDATSARNAPRRARVSPNEVDYGDDVTVRTFTYNSPAKRTRVPSGRTAQYGDDVTVRYFTPATSVTKTAAR